MSGIKGWPSQKKITYQNETYNEFVTIQPVGSDKNAADVVPKYAFRSGAVDTVEAGTTEQIIIATAHGALPGDFIRFETGTYTYWELPVVRVTANEMYLGTRLDTAPAPGDTFYIMKYTTNRVDPTGAIIATPGPTQYVLDGVDTQVNEDTVVPANSRSLPVGMFATTGERLLTPAKSSGVALGVSNVGHDVLDTAILDYGVTNVDNVAWTEVIANVGACSGITLFDSGGYSMEIGFGAAAAETRAFVVPPGGFNGVIGFIIPNNTRISVRAIGAPLVNVGELIINFLE